MTSRTYDIYCHACRKYMFSLMPHDRGHTDDYYCKLPACQEQAVIDKLKKK